MSEHFNRLDEPVSEAPEVIWMDMRMEILRRYGSPFITQGFLAKGPRTQYIRADLHEARIAELEGAMAAVLDGYDGCDLATGEPGYMTQAYNNARAALQKGDQ
ncbi:MAG: hypothetical protein AAF360_15585 [Pseudomonadota bacterium]